MKEESKEEIVQPLLQKSPPAPEQQPLPPASFLSLFAHTTP